jgi:hypothetical protein
VVLSFEDRPHAIGWEDGCEGPLGSAASLKNKQLQRGGGRMRRKLVLLGQVIRQHAATRMAPGRIVLPSHHFPLVSRLRAPPQGSRKHWPRPCGISPCRLLQLPRSAPDKHPGCRRLVKPGFEKNLIPLSDVTVQYRQLDCQQLYPTCTPSSKPRNRYVVTAARSLKAVSTTRKVIRSEIETVCSLCSVKPPGAAAAS